MDKLIKELDRIASFYRFDNVFDSFFTEDELIKFRARDEVSSSISDALKRYRVRQQSAARSLNGISSEQFSQIENLVSTASDYWDMINDECPTSLDKYRSGYINAVLHMCSIFGIDQKRIKK